MNVILDFEALKQITNRTGVSATKAQVIADLQKMGIKFQINSRGYPISCVEAYERYIFGRSNKKPAQTDNAQSVVQVLSRHG